MSRPPVLILHAPGTNRDREAAWACELAGGAPEIVTVKALVEGHKDLMDYRMMVLPGGFSHGDDLGAGRVWSLALRHALRAPMTTFVEAGRPVLGICNGFQALIKAGLLGGDDAVWETEPSATLTHNASAQFECRWVTLEPDAQSVSVFTRDLKEPIFCPVAHGEGRLVTRGPEALASLKAQGRVVLRYTSPGQGEAGYPANPNGSEDDIASICNARGTVMGLMPHPEDHITARQHPRHGRGEQGRLGLALFEGGVSYAAGLD